VSGTAVLASERGVVRPASLVLLRVSSMLANTKWKWGTFTRLETRTKESNRHARGKTNEENASLVLKGWDLSHGVHYGPTPTGPLRVEFECACLDPKGGELCLNKMKSGETRMEVCSDADVQIARMIWVSERKTHRTT